MKFTGKRMVLTVFATACMLSCTPAGSFAGNTAYVASAEAAVKAPALNKTKISIYVNKTYTLKVKNNKKKVKWSSTDKNIAKVSKMGKVTALAEGECYIKAKVKGGKIYKCLVNVRRKMLKKAYFDKEDLVLAPGEKGEKKVITKPENYSNEDFSWSSANDCVATVSKKGKVKAVSEGRVMITAIRGDVIASYYVTVAPKPLESLTMTGLMPVMYEGENQKLLCYTNPDNYTAKDLTWSSSNTDIAEVDEEGVVSANLAGTAIITAKRGDVSASFPVTVRSATVLNDSSVITINTKEGNQKLVTIDNPRRTKMYIGTSGDNSVSGTGIKAEWFGDSKGVTPTASAEGFDKLQLLVTGYNDGDYKVLIYNDAGQTTAMDVSVSSVDTNVNIMVANSYFSLGKLSYSAYTTASMLPGSNLALVNLNIKNTGFSKLVIAPNGSVKNVASVTAKYTVYDEKGDVVKTSNEIELPGANTSKEYDLGVLKPGAYYVVIHDITPQYEAE